MATVGTPNGGLDEITERVYVNGADFSLVAYTNTADSLGPDTVTADLTTPTESNGYAPILLNGTWTTSNGVLSYDHDGAGANPAWEATGAWSATVTGIAMVSGARVIHFKDLAAAFTAANGRRLVADLTGVAA